jgi:hypothetical protein
LAYLQGRSLKAASKGSTVRPSSTGWGKRIYWTSFNFNRPYW